MLKARRADELDDIRIAALGAKNPGDAASAAVLVLVARIDAEDLREVLDVNGGTVRQAVEAPNGERPKQRRHVKMTWRLASQPRSENYPKTTRGSGEDEETVAVRSIRVSKARIIL